MAQDALASAKNEKDEFKRKQLIASTLIFSALCFEVLLTRNTQLIPTMRIDTKLLNEAESSDGTQTKEEVAQGLRLKVATVGKTEWKGAANRPARR